MNIKALTKLAWTPEEQRLLDKAYHEGAAGEFKNISEDATSSADTKSGWGYGALGVGGSAGLGLGGLGLWDLWKTRSQMPGSPWRSVLGEWWHDGSFRVMPSGPRPSSPPSSPASPPSSPSSLPPSSSAPRLTTSALVPVGERGVATYRAPSTGSRPAPAVEAPIEARPMPPTRRSRIPRGGKALASGAGALLTAWLVNKALQSSADDSRTESADAAENWVKALNKIKDLENPPE